MRRIKHIKRQYQKGPTPLTQAFFDKLNSLIESGPLHGIGWNHEGTGCLILDEDRLEALLMSRINIHFHTFIKMLLLYGFKKTTTVNGDSYSHYCIADRKWLQAEEREQDYNNRAGNKKYSSRQNLNSEEEKRQQQPQDPATIALKIEKQKLQTAKIEEVSKSLKATNSKREGFERVLRQRCALNSKLIDTVMFKINTRDSDNTILLNQIKVLKQSIKRNEEDIRSSITYLEKNKVEEEELLQLLKDQPVVQSSESLMEASPTNKSMESPVISGAIQKSFAPAEGTAVMSAGLLPLALNTSVTPIDNQNQGFRRALNRDMFVSEQVVISPNTPLVATSSIAENIIPSPPSTNIKIVKVQAFRPVQRIVSFQPVTESDSAQAQQCRVPQAPKIQEEGVQIKQQQQFAAMPSQQAQK